MTPEAATGGIGITIIILIVAAIGILIWLVHSHKVSAEKLGKLGDFLDDFKLNKSNVAATAPAPAPVDHPAVINAVGAVIAAVPPTADHVAIVNAVAAVVAATAPPATAQFAGGLFGQTPEEATARAAMLLRNAADLAAAGGPGVSYPPGYDLDEMPARRNPAEPANTYRPYTFTIKQKNTSGRQARINIGTVAGDGGDGGTWTVFLTKDGVAGPETLPGGGPENAHDFQVFDFPSEPGSYVFNIKRDRVGGVTLQLKPNG